MKKLLAVTLLLSAFCYPAAHAEPAGDDAAAVAQIDTLVKAFQAAIVARDRAALEAMFLPADNSWLTVASDGIRLKPGQPRVRPSTYLKFTEFVGTREALIYCWWMRLVLKNVSSKTQMPRHTWVWQGICDAAGRVFSWLRSPP